MQILQELQLDELNLCPYLPDRQKQFQYFFAQNLNETEIDSSYQKGGANSELTTFGRPAPHAETVRPSGSWRTNFNRPKANAKI